MTDRPNMSAYPMPNGFPMNMSQQQQQQQQQQMMQQQMQANSNPLQPSANFSTPEQRMWQLQRLQMENQRRAQMGVGDGMGSQMNPQMAELLRTQLMTQGQLAQMQPNQMQQAQGPQYGNVGQMGQMNPMNLGQAGQHQQAIGQLQQSHPQAGMQGAGQNLNPSQASALLARGMNPAMLSVIQNNPRMVNRQMNLLNTARNQQPQNGPAAFPPHNLPFNNGQLGQASFQQDPRVPQQGQIHALNVTPDNLQAQFAQFAQEFMRTKEGRQLSFDEIRMKISHFKRDIDADKILIGQMANNVTAESLPLMKQKQQSTFQKELFFNRLQQLLLQNQVRAQQQLHPSSGGDGGAGPSNLNLQPNIGAQQAQLSPNAGWVAQENRVNGNAPGPISTPNMANAQTGNGQPQLSTSPFHPSVGQRQQTTPVPRLGPTPQQQQQAMEALLRQNHPSPQRGPTPAASVQNRPPQSMQPFDHADGQRVGMGSLPSLDRAKFEEIIKQWWQQNNINVEERMLAVGDRRIDLYDLYVEVTRLGGAVAVNRHELWPVVAAKLGWANMPTQSSEPARSGPQAANHMKVVYDLYVMTFEQQVSSANLREFLSGHGPRDHQPPDGGPNQQPPGPQGQPPPQSTRPPLQPAQLQLLNLVRFANTSADVLRRNNVPESIVQQVELHRVALQRQYQIQLQRNPNFPQGTPSNAMQNLSNQQQVQMSNLGGFIGGQSQNGGLNQTFNTPGPSAAPSGQNGLQHPPNGQMGQSMMEKSNQQRWTEANVAIARLKEEFARERNSQPTVPRDISDVEKGQINAFFEGFVRLANDIERILPMFFYLCNDLNSVKHLVSIVDIVTRQRKLLQSPNPIYIIDLNTLKKLYYISNQARDKFQEMVQRQKLQDPGRIGAANMPQPPPGSGGGMPMPAGPQAHPAMQGQMTNAGPIGLQRPPSRQPQQSQIPPHLMQAPPVNRPPMMPPARPPSVSQGRSKTENAHSPAAPASTPGPSASTPNTLASPQTPKSPKPKAKPKGQAKQRRPSKAVAPAPSAASASTAPAQGPSVAENSLKRQREDDTSSSVLGGPDVNDDAGTPAKRIKGEWDETPDSGPSKVQKEIEDIKTPEKAAQFYKDMSQLMEILQNPNDNNGAGLDSDILETLATVAASCISQEASDVLSSELNGKDSSPKLGSSGVDALFNEFLDFTSFPQDDEKIDTPDLIPSSSTNPSPESNAEPDNHTLPMTGGEVGKASDIKSELTADYSDPLRMGIWGELDGGESSYYTSDSLWKWDGSTSSENSWAISSSS